MKAQFVFFDCDGVLTFDNIWPQMNELVHLSPELDKQWFDDYYAGKITFEKWNNNIENKFIQEKLTLKQINKLLINLKVNPEAINIINYIHSKNIPTAVISSGFDLYVKKYARMLNIPIWKANSRFLFDEKGYFTKLVSEIEDPLAKVLEIKTICQRYNIAPTETIFVGDSINDLGAFDLTKHGVLYKSKNEDYRKHAWKTIDNLNELKEILA